MIENGLTQSKAPSKSDTEPQMRLEYRDPRSLTSNPKNWRKHGSRQRQAFSDLLDEVGMIDGVILNERTGHLLDGHMRVEEFIERNEPQIPVIIVDLPEDKEHTALMFKDRVGAMNDVDMTAETDLAKLIDTESQALANLMAHITKVDYVMEQDDESTDQDDPLSVGLVPSERYNYVVLLFRTEIDWYAALDHFRLERQRSPFITNQVKLGRVLDGGDYLRRVLHGDDPN
jgi:hypothetical protein